MLFQNIRSILVWLMALMSSGNNNNNNGGTITPATPGSLLECPSIAGSSLSFTSKGETITLQRSDHAVLCTLVFQDTATTGTTTDGDSSSWVPVARMYDSHGWERSGSGFAATNLSGEFDCDNTSCQAWLPEGNYMLQTRRTTAPELNLDHEVARFLETASFGVTPNDLETWNDGNSFASYVHDQMVEIEPTYHREFFRRHANTHWRFHKPEFAGHLDPCEPGSTWRRTVFNVKDSFQRIDVTPYGDDENNPLWQINVKDDVRTIVPRLRFVNDGNQVQGRSKICSNLAELRTGVYKIEAYGQCREIMSEDLVVTFPDGYEPPGTLSNQISALSDQDAWRKTSDYVEEYRFLGYIAPDSCEDLPDPDPWGRPVFVRTSNNEWMIHDPRIVMEENTVENPLDDGGAASWSLDETLECSNVRRSMFNEAGCKLSDTVACESGATEKSQSKWGVVVCGSPGEVSNDLDLGDTWLDITSIDGGRSRALKVPKDTTGPDSLQRQRVFIWNTLALQSKDQLRQRMAWALLQIFALPKSAIGSQKFNTEIFLIYYDIFVRHAFGNYKDILREVTYNPLMAESLSFRESKSVGLVHAYTCTSTSGCRLAYPDENYARELMQLFTIGLVELHMDGTPVLDENNKPIRTYDSDDIISFARIWTGFSYQPSRGNVEGYDFVNRFDPLGIVAEWRDRFPKPDLYDGYIGDGYPLCVDLPDKLFLRAGAKYRLLGSSPKSVYNDDEKSWSEAASRLKLEANGSGLYERLCNANGGDSCSYPGLVVLPSNLGCPSNTDAQECKVDTVRVVQVEDLYYEYVKNVPCVEMAFFDNGVRANGLNKNYARKVCVNPDLTRASEACCKIGAALWKAEGHPNCLYAGERMTMETAAARCAEQGKELCNYSRFFPSDSCPHFGFHYTGIECRIQVKVNAEGETAIVHDAGNPVEQVTPDTPSYFRANWDNGIYPTADDDCGDVPSCVQLEGACLCDVEVSEATVFTSPPSGPNEILKELRIGHANPNLYDSALESYETKGYRVHTPDGSCCNSETVFEVTEENGRTRFWRNVVSTVSIEGADELSFRNPPQFNSELPTEYSIIDAEHESEALLDHLFYHKNTAPFVAIRLIQRFGFSNPSPRYVMTVATAFRDGTYSADGVIFGTGDYGDLAATAAAVLLDREARSSVLEDDPSHGSLREPVLKVLGFMRAMDFQSTVPLVDLDWLSRKVGQMVYDQPTVFSFFRPEYSSPGLATKATLTSPEAEVMSAGKVVGILNGLFALVDNGLQNCENGLGLRGCEEPSTGEIVYQPADAGNRAGTIAALSTLLTSGRLSAKKQNILLQAINNEPDDNEAWRTAMKLIVTTPEFHATNKVDSVQAGEDKAPLESVTNDGSKGYKAVIHLALHGGCDSFNMLAPHPECGDLSQSYKETRDTIALLDSNLLKIEGDTTGQPCQTFGLHNELPFLKQLYDDGDLLFMANVGVLTEFCDKGNFQSRTETQLFAHNAMQDEVDTLDPRNLERGTGALGRLADVLLGNEYRAGRTAVEVPPRNLAGRLEAISPVFALDGGAVTPLDVNLSSPVLKDVMGELNGEPKDAEKSGVFGELWSSILGRSLNQTEKVFYLLQSNTATQTNFTDGGLGSRFKLISQLIATREKREVDRDLFSVRFEGFDMHGEVTESLNDRFLNMNEAIESLVTELKLLGVWDDVVLVQTSDFGRTLSPNSGGGSDHGWGGNYFMMGGGVKGNQIVGKYLPTFSPDGELNLQRGRVIPTTAWESPFNAIAEWMGVSTEEDMDTVLPNRNSFDNLFHVNDVFKNT